MKNLLVLVKYVYDSFSQNTQFQLVQMFVFLPHIPQETWNFSLCSTLFEHFFVILNNFGNNFKKPNLLYQYLIGTIFVNFWVILVAKKKQLVL